METFPSGTQTVAARSLSAEVRARIGADRSLTGQRLAQAIGLSQNYIAKRLRDELPFTMDDVERIASYFGEDPYDFLTAALRNHEERISEELSRSIRQRRLEAGVLVGVDSAEGLRDWIRAWLVERQLFGQVEMDKSKETSGKVDFVFVDGERKPRLIVEVKRRGTAGFTDLEQSLRQRTLWDSPMDTTVVGALIDSSYFEVKRELESLIDDTRGASVGQIHAMIDQLKSPPTLEEAIEYLNEPPAPQVQKRAAKKTPGKPKMGEE